MRVHGVRQFHSMASFLTYCLGMVRSDVTLLDAPHLGVAEALSQLEPGDVVIVAICAPYTRSVAEVGRIAAANGQSVIAITDSLSSTLVPPAEHAFSFLMPAASIRTAWAAMSYSARHCSTSSPASLATRR
jgi:DNA-binding MurR/RpiR family transcriptional regulator